MFYILFKHILLLRKKMQGNLKENINKKKLCFQVQSKKNNPLDSTGGLLLL